MNIVKFLLSVALTTGVSIVAVPVVLHVAGPVEWSGIAVAQSAAGLAGVFIAFGWGATGPTAVAQREGSARGAYYRSSVPARVYLGLAATPVTLLVTALAAPGDVLVDLVAALAVLVGALAAPWFFVGEKAPWRLLVLDTVPRAAATAAGAVLLVLTGSLIVFPLCLLAGAVTAVALTARSVTRRYPGPAAPWAVREALGALGGQRHGMTTAGAAALYVNLPIVLVGAVTPLAAPVYAIGDKLQKITVVGFTPLLQVAQGHLGTSGGELVARVRRVALLAAASGVVIGGLFAGLAPIAATVLSVGTIALPWSVSSGLGVAIAGICVSAIVGLACLAALDRMRVVARSTVAGAVAGVPLIVVLGLLLGAPGVAWAVASAELLVVGVQLAALRTALRDRTREERPAPATEPVGDLR